MAEDIKRISQAVWKSRAGVAANWSMLAGVGSLLVMGDQSLQTVQDSFVGSIPLMKDFIELFKDPKVVEDTISLVEQYWVEGVATLFFGTSGTHAISRINKTEGRASEHFTQKEYTDFPQQRPGYSDRAAYTMAELSELAYQRIRPAFEIPEQLSDALKKLFPKEGGVIDQITESVNKESNEIDNCSLESFKEKLELAEFTYIDHFDDKEVQGFVCLKDKAGVEPYIVVSFRGSEARVEDWLTNATARPSKPTLGKGSVHTGFYDGFMRVKPMIVKALEDAQAKSGASTPVPVFYTGHSMGGALALIAARTFEYEAKQNDGPENISGACYTYGAPRIGDYKYFEQMKTPVYRVVNSSDIVPRVPPGAWSKVFSLLLKGLSQIMTWQPTVTKALEKLEDYFSTLHVYRHHGDMRFLPDVADVNEDANPEILSNPNQLDLSLWFWRRISVSFGSPVKSHSMLIYLKKLTNIATHRL